MMSNPRYKYLYTVTMKPILAHPLYLPFFLHIVTLLLAGSSSTPSYTPIDDITLACGFSGNQPTTNYNLRNWTGDINSKFSPTQVDHTNTHSEVRKAPFAGQVPFNAARLSHSAFTYRFPLSPGQKFIRLHFNPASYPDFDRSKSHFSVKAGGFTLLKDFNAFASAKNDFMDTFIREFCINIDSHQQSLNITFSPTREIPDAYAFINGIEIVSMPVNLYYTAAESQGIRYTGSQLNYYIENSTALEMMYRINIGGNLVSPEGDTGMYRSWDATDGLYLDDVSRRLSIIYTSRVQLSFDETPEYTAPKEVYITGRSMGPNKTVTLSYDLTWSFPVHPEFFYLVRLHFCEFEEMMTDPGDRVFFIYLANQTVEKQLDIIQWSGGNGVPVYRDYIVYMPGQGSRKSVNLFLALQANPNEWETKYSDAILNGLEIFKLNDTNGNLAGPNPDPPPPEEKPNVKQESSRKPKKKSIPMLAILVGVVSVLLVLSLVGILVFERGRKLKYSSSNPRMTRSTTNLESTFPSYLCRYFSLAEIKSATKNFDDTLIVGIGGFGHVYKGHFDDGATLVAIKRLKATSLQGTLEFMTEIKMLSRLRHRHLVSLIGYCADQGEMVLVYDYMARGTLSDHLHHTEKPHLSWEQRLQICIGAAQGLHYLHTGTKGTIIHRDVKSANILIDEKWVAKISDFGLSKMGNITMSKTHISTKVKGSFGYLDPDYYRRQQLTEKSDVYSFGVVLCEVLCGRPAVTIVDNNRVGLAGWVKKCHRDGKLDQIVDPNLKSEIAVRCLHKFASIAMSCMDDNGINRPSMDDVVGGLQFALQMQEKNEDYIDHIERTVQDEISLIKDNEGSCSSEQTSGANESVQELTRTIFSEIIDPVGR